jgi:hypothetical protein
VHFGVCISGSNRGAGAWCLLRHVALRRVCAFYPAFLVTHGNVCFFNWTSNLGRLYPHRQISIALNLKKKKTESEKPSVVVNVLAKACACRTGSSYFGP